MESLLSDRNHKENIILLPGDLIRVYSENVFNTVKYVTIDGVVRNPSSYTLKTNMTIKDLILEAGGLNSNVYRYRVEVARIDPLNDNLDVFSNVITFNIDEKFRISPGSFDDISKREDSFQLKPYDLVTIRPDPYFSTQKQVVITGEVLYPGSYTILSYDEKITDIIKRAGGLRPNAYSFGSSFSRKGKNVQLDIARIEEKPKSKLNIEIQDGDEIFIAAKPQIIEVIGEVSVPGLYKFQPGKRINDVIKMAGGYSQNAEKDDIYIRYPNGISMKYNRWLANKKIKDGSIITVGKKKEEEPFDRTEYAKELTSILANLAQAITMIFLAIK